MLIAFKKKKKKFKLKNYILYIIPRSLSLITDFHSTESSTLKKKKNSDTFAMFILNVWTTICCTSCELCPRIKTKPTMRWRQDKPDHETPSFGTGYDRRAGKTCNWKIATKKRTMCQEGLSAVHHIGNTKLCRRFLKECNSASKFCFKYQLQG